MVIYKVVKDGWFMNRNNSTLVKMIMLSIFVAIGVVISPILRVVGFCPTQHFVNIVCAVFLGPWYALLCATLIGIIRMSLMAIPPLALTGAVFGAFLSGVLYKRTNKLIMACIGEVIGTGIIGSIVSVPVMKFFFGKSNLTLFFYTPSFVLATLMGATVAFAFLKAMQKNKMLDKLKESING